MERKFRRVNMKLVWEMDLEEAEAMEQRKKEFKGYRYQNGLVRENPQTLELGFVWHFIRAYTLILTTMALV